MSILGEALAKIRVHELAKDLGITSKELLNTLKQQGEFVKSASSTLEAPLARALRKQFEGNSRGDLRTRPVPVGQVNAPQISGDLATGTPRSIESSWRAGAVKVPDNPDLDESIRRLSSRHVELAQHRALLQSLGSQIVYARFCKEDQFRQCGVVLVRFSGAIEAAFGLTREVLFFYTSFEDFQVRAFHAAKKVLSNLARDVTPDLIFINARDPRLRVKLDDWSRPDLMAIPLLLSDDFNEMSLISLIRDYIFSRDLFYETTPVYGSKFFGRRTLLQSLDDDVRNQRVAGLFGLRKAGKTSVLKQLSQNIEAANSIPILIDLEAFPSPPDDPTPDIMAELRRKLVFELKERRLRHREVSNLPKIPKIVEMKIALQDLLSKLQPEGVRILLMLDEIEYLTPSDQIDISEGPMPQIAQMLGALRSIVQESSNFTFILSGLTSAIIENGRLYGRPNPLFSWAKAHYLGPFEKSEADELAQSIGGKMGVEIERGALQALFDASGGHAYVYRNLASKVVESLPVDVYRRIIRHADVLNSFLPWKASVSGNVDEMVSHVRRYYPTESVLLDCLMESPDDFSQLAAGEDQAVHHLLNLGLVHRNQNGYAVNSLLDIR